MRIFTSENKQILNNLKIYIMEAFNRLNELKKQFPELTFDNEGYQYLPVEIREKYKEQIKEIEDILRKKFNPIHGVVNFNNFKPRKNGGFYIRVQMYWDNSFKGVSYININDLKK